MPNLSPPPWKIPIQVSGQSQRPVWVGPRTANVTAGPEGVRGLILRRAELHAILEERPEAAMAMLATLAERLGTDWDR